MLPAFPQSPYSTVPTPRGCFASVADAGFGVYRAGVSLAMYSSIAGAGALALFGASRYWPFDPIAGAWLPWAAVSIPVIVFGTNSIAYIQSRDRMREKAVLDFIRRAVVVASIMIGVIYAGFPGFVAARVSVANPASQHPLTRLCCNSIY